MLVKDVIKELKKYNPKARLDVVAKDMAQKYSFSYGSTECTTKEKCNVVVIYLDDLNSNNTEL